MVLSNTNIYFFICRIWSLIVLYFFTLSIWNTKTSDNNFIVMLSIINNQIEYCSDVQLGGRSESSFASCFAILEKNDLRSYLGRMTLWYLSISFSILKPPVKASLLTRKKTTSLSFCVWHKDTYEAQREKNWKVLWSKLWFYFTYILLWPLLVFESFLIL